MGKQKGNAPKSLLAKRLWEIYGNYKYSDLTKIFGVSSETCRSYLTGITVPDADVLLRIIQHSGRNGHWLLTGEGQAFAHSAKEPLPYFADEQKEKIYRGVPIKKIVNLLEPMKVGEASKYGVSSKLDWGPNDLDIGMVEIIDDGSRVIIDRTLPPVQGKPAIFEKEGKLYIGIYEKEEKGVRAYRMIATLI